MPEDRYLLEKELIMNECGTLFPHIFLDKNIVNFIHPEGAKVDSITTQPDYIEVLFKFEENDYCCRVPYHKILRPKILSSEEDGIKRFLSLMQRNEERAR